MKKFILILCIAIFIIVSFILYREVFNKEENIKNTTINMANSKENESMDKQNKNLYENQNEKNVSNVIKIVEENTTEGQDENKLDSAENNVIEKSENNITYNSNITNIEKQKITESLAPSGFMGSSLLRVVLLSNGEVYLFKYDGEGYEEKNIVNKELIALNADSISSNGQGEDFEAIIVKGKSNMVIKTNNYGWIEFQK